ncbi:MAG: SHD1 domain-containing protein [bacterium]
MKNIAASVVVWVGCLLFAFVARAEPPAGEPGPVAQAGVSGEGREVRTWTATSGAKLEARLISAKGDSVVLATQDGTRKTIKLKQLSKEDQDYVKEVFPAIGAEQATGGKAGRGLKAILGKSVGDLKLWLDASDAGTVKVTSGKVSEWKDKTTNGFNAVQSNEGNRPTYNKDAKVAEAKGTMPMVHFEQGGQWLFTDCIPATGKNPRTLVIAVANVKQIEQSLLCHLLHYGSPVNEKAYGITSRGWHSVNWGNHYWHGALNSGIPTDSGGGYIVVASFADGADNFTVNGGKTFTQGDNWPQGQVDTGGAAGQVHGLVIGGRIQGGEGAWADFGEVLAFSKALTKEERQKVEGYLANKWGMTSLLPNGHPYKSQKP